MARRAVVRRRHGNQPVHRAPDVRVRVAAGGRDRARAAARPTWTAVALGVLTALASPVAALFAALAAAAFAIGKLAKERSVRAAVPGLLVVIAALLPVALLSVAFPEGGSEPFAFSTLWPILAIALVAIVLIPKRELTLLAGIVLYALGCIAAYEVATPVGSNAARLGPLLAGPLVALLVAAPPQGVLAGRGAAVAVPPVAGADPRRPHVGRRPIGHDRLLPAAAGVPREAVRAARSGSRSRSRAFTGRPTRSRRSSRSRAAGSASSTSSTTASSTTVG